MIVIIIISPFFSSISLRSSFSLSFVGYCIRTSRKIWFPLFFFIIESLLSYLSSNSPPPAPLALFLASLFAKRMAWAMSPCTRYNYHEPRFCLLRNKIFISHCYIQLYYLRGSNERIRKKHYLRGDGAINKREYFGLWFLFEENVGERIVNMKSQILIILINF